MTHFEYLIANDNDYRWGLVTTTAGLSTDACRICEYDLQYGVFSMEGKSFQLAFLPDIIDEIVAASEFIT